MKTTAGYVVVVLMALLPASCNQKSTETVTNATPSFAFHSSKCLGGLVLLKGTQHDSSFAYSFDDTLAIDFSVTTNCRPDSDRFAVSSTAGSDTLALSIVDTARYLCRCICPYFIHAEFANLRKDHYVVRCRLVNVDAPYMSQDPIYLVDVYREKSWKI